MTARIEAAANIVVIVLAVVLGSVFLKERLSSPAPEPEAIKAGAKLPTLNGWIGCFLSKLAQPSELAGT